MMTGSTRSTVNKPGNIAQAARQPMQLLYMRQLSIEDHLAWQNLSQAASGDSVFAASWFVQSVLAHFDPRQQFQLLVYRAPDGQWNGILPLVRAARLGRIPFRHCRNLLDANQFMGVPLVRPGHEYAFWHHLFDLFDNMESGFDGIRLAEMPDDHRATRALQALCRDQGRALECLSKKQRAAWRPCGDTTANAGTDPRRRRRLAALERQLAQHHGPVRLEAIEVQRQLDRWVDEFLALEIAGWKGRQGSALASDSATASHFRHIAHMGFAAGQFRALTLRAGCRPVAMTSYFLEGEHGFGFKMAFDESFARFAPGIMLKRMLMRRYGANTNLYFDSCSTADAAMINSLWPERRTIGDYVVATGRPGDNHRFAMAMSARRAWHRIKFWRDIAALASPF